MSKQVLVLLTLFLTSIRPVLSQQTALVDIGGPKYVNLTDQLPENLASSRSAVVVSVPPNQGQYVSRGQWKELTSTLHKNFRKVGIDAITYVYVDDLNSGPEVLEAYRQIFEQRNVRNLIYVSVEQTAAGTLYSLLITLFKAESFLENDQQAWKQSSPDLDMVILRLGRQILRQEMSRSNFLIPEGPEYLDDLVVFTGTRMENYPSRLQSLSLAVVAFQKVPTDNINDAEMRKQIEEYNQRVEADNQELASIMKSYPFKYEIVDETDEDKLYQRGFQYALIPLSSTGKFIKQALNYPTNPTETIYVSNVLTTDSLKALKRMPVDANVTKYYIKQTIVKDLHVGKVWDADVTWQRSLVNFLFHLKSAFNR